MLLSYMKWTGAHAGGGSAYCKPAYNPGRDYVMRTSTAADNDPREAQRARVKHLRAVGHSVRTIAYLVEMPRSTVQDILGGTDKHKAIAPYYLFLAELRRPSP